MWILIFAFSAVLCMVLAFKFALAGSKDNALKRDTNLFVLFAIAAALSMIATGMAVVRKVF